MNPIRRGPANSIARAFVIIPPSQSRTWERALSSPFLHLAFGLEPRRCLWWANVSIHRE